MSTWDSSYPLVVANESTGDRPWLGEIYLLAGYCQALSAEQVDTHYQLGY